jgi:hypothetical protein
VKPSRRRHIHQRASARLAVDEVFVSEVVGRKCLRRQDVIAREARVVGKDRIDRHAGAEFAQHYLNGNARRESRACHS